MKATLTFNLDDLEDKESFFIATKSADYLSAIEEIIAHLRYKAKYEEHSEEVYLTIDVIRDKVFEILSDHKIVM